jgi:phosphate transport system permease protein
MDASVNQADFAQGHVPWGRVRRTRHVADRALKIVCTLFTAIGAFVLGWILLMLLFRGFSALSPAVFTETMPGPGSEGAASPTPSWKPPSHFLGIAVATPVGVMAGTSSRIRPRLEARRVVRFLNDVLLSAPSTSSGLFVYTLMVQPMGTYSAGPAAWRLAIIATPVIVRTTEDMLRIVPVRSRGGRRRSAPRPRP